MKKSYLLLHIAVLLAGFTGVFGKLISINEGLLVWYRVLFTSVLLFLLLKLTKTSANLNTRTKFQIGAVGMLLTIHWLFFYGSIKYANISIGVVCYSLTSFFTAFFVPIINKKRFVPSEILLSMFTLAGIAMIFHFDASYQTGIILGVVSSAFAALFTIYNERLVKVHDSKVINFYQMIGGTIGLGMLMPLYLHFFPVNKLLPNLNDTIYLLALSLFCTVGLYILFAESLKRLSAFTVNLSFNLEPIYAIIIAFAFFGEGKQVNNYFYGGLFCVIASVVLQTFMSVKKSAKISTP